MKHLLSIDELSVEDIDEILSTARSFEEVGTRAIKKVPILRGRTVCNLFFEPSTRTRISFELAAKRLSADVINFTADASSSRSKGESFKDTALTLQAMGVDAIVVRHHSSGAPQRLASWLDSGVINAGDGFHEHPTQALLDLFSVSRRVGELSGLKVGIVGDVIHSRVARSNIKAFSKMGSQVTVIGPPTLLPRSVGGWGAEISNDLDDVLPKLDVVYLLRVQNERESGQLLPSMLEYSRFWGLNRERFSKLKSDALIMHPGPMNRGVEISSELAELKQSIVTDQVTNGIAVRAAVLYLMLGGPDSAESGAGDEPGV